MSIKKIELKKLKYSYYKMFVKSINNDRMCKLNNKSIYFLSYK